MSSFVSQCKTLLYTVEREFRRLHADFCPQKCPANCHGCREFTCHREHATVEGAVFSVFTRAKQAYEKHRGMDEAFDWLMEDVLASMNDLARDPACRRYDGGVTIQLSQEASGLLHRALEMLEVGDQDSFTFVKEGGETTTLRDPALVTEHIL